MDRRRYILAGSFIDGASNTVSRNVCLTVKDSKIIAVGSITDLPESCESRIDDFSHCTILPPFVDCSVFLTRSPSITQETESTNEQGRFLFPHPNKLALLEKHTGFCHAYGVLGVAANDDITKQANQWQSIWKREGLIEVRIPELAPLNGSVALGIATDCTYLKINYSNSIDEDGMPSPVLHTDSLYRILQQRGNKKAVVVANGPRQVHDALTAGCDAIEQGYAMGENNLRIMAKENVLWIPSVLRAKNGLDSSSSGGDVCCRFSQRYAAPGEPVPGAEEFWQKMLSDQLRLLRLAREFGVKTAVGTGAGARGILHGESMAEEIKLFMKAGFSLAEAIGCASKTGAELFGMQKLGALGVGQSATFLLTRGTAGQLPRKLSYLEGIYIDGIPSRAYRKDPVIND